MKFFTCLIFLYCILYSAALKFDSANKDFLPSLKTCGLQHVKHPQRDTQVGEFPWVVFLPLQSRIYNPGVDLRCAGTLISKRYVIIRRPCLQFVLTNVFIGQHNVTCTDEDNCGPVEIRGVEHRVSDPNENVELLRLDRDVEFTDNIRPICLPFDNFKKPQVGTTMFTSGWGQNSNEGGPSEIKKKVKHTLINNEECQQRGAIENASDSNLMCIKLHEDSASPACYGDEGSPIMYITKNNQYVLGGVFDSAFDPDYAPCAIKNPALGVRITDETLEWMIENMHA